MNWDDEQSLWRVNITQEQGPNQGSDAIKVKETVCADYFIPLTSIFDYPKLPLLPGMDLFKGHQFHTSRWDYQFTGGSQEHPELNNLRAKTIGLVGTGATAIQVFPMLAKYAKHIYLFQRTPSAVAERGQGLTDPVRWKKDRSRPGWQRARRDNFAGFNSNEADQSAENFTQDGWTTMPSYQALVGGLNNVNPMDPATIPAHLTHLQSIDLPRQEQIRARVDQIVKDSATAEKLKAYYPSWCKRPCFHDDYLPAFNQPNVTLVDTQGKGIDRLTENTVVVGNEEYQVDALIWGTGFATNLGGASADASPTGRASISIRGRNGRLLSDKWNESVGTLYGFCTNEFPNFFLSLSQGGVCANNTHIYEANCDQVVYTVKKAEEQNPGKRVTIEPSKEAEETWSMRVAMNAAAFAGLAGCTPSYFNGQGKADAARQAMTQEQQMKAARAAPWGKGILDYQRITQAWRDEGKLEGLNVVAVN